jgi:hypothetical protein
VLDSFVGAAMMLFGAGEWGPWWYLLVFFSIPGTLSLLFLVPAVGKNFGVLVVFARAITRHDVWRSLALTPLCVSAMLQKE